LEKAFWPALEGENPDQLAAPRTDSGTVPNLKFSFSAAHNRLLTGGWAREITVRELPVATELAGVNMRLKAAASARCTGTRRRSGRT
jgi:oxalate decarboxylase